MILKCLLCCLLLRFAVGDVKLFSATYLPPSPQEGGAKTPEVVLKALDVPDVSQNEVVEKDVKLGRSEALTQEPSKDPVYGFPGPYYNPGFPGQIYPRPVYPTGGFSGPGFVNPPIPPQGFPGPVLPGQSFPGQSYPGQGFPGQGLPGQGYPGQGFPGQGFPTQWLPGQGFVNPGFGPPGYPNYPAPYTASEQLQKETDNYNEDNKLRLLISHTDTQYDAANGGYLYKKPTVSF